MFLSILSFFQEESINRNFGEYSIMIFIQILLLSIFIYMLKYFCNILKKKEGKLTKKTCIIIGGISAVGWYIIAHIVWIVTAIQYPGS